MPVMQQYKCPSCGGAIEFDSASQNMKCPYCDTEFDIETLKKYDQELQNQPAEDMQWDTSSGAQWQEGEESHLRGYVCNSCGGQIVTDATTAATHCPYCGNPVVLMDQLSGVLKPDYVIPFKLDKNAAKEAFRKHCKGKPLLPKLFLDDAHIDKIRGVYVPFWLFDADADANIRYHATRIRTWSDSNYYYTKTSHYSVVRAGNLSFQQVPVDGSSKMEDALMESLEPFNFADAVDFQTAYLSGYLADRYDVDAEHSVQRANQRIRKSTEDAFAGTVSGYSTVAPEQTSIRLENGTAKYALFPVWLLNTTWKDKCYTFAMNGQTGRFVGDLPVDWSAFWKWFLGLGAGIGAALYAIMWLSMLL